MDFGYAFDSLVFDSNPEDIGSGYADRTASIVAEAIQAEIVPQRYLTDAEILVVDCEDSDFAISEKFLAQKNLLETVAIKLAALPSESASGPTHRSLNALAGQTGKSVTQLRRRYSRVQSL